MLADVLKKWRLASGLSLRAVAAQIGIGYSTLSRVENGTMPDPQTFIAILNWLVKGKPII